MPKGIRRALITSLRAVLVLTVFFGISRAYAQVPRFYVDITVFNGDLGAGVAYSVAMEFIDTLDFKGLSQLEAPDKGFVDPESLKRFLPPLLKGPRAYTEVVDGPKTKRDCVICWAFVEYSRESKDQSEWDDIWIFIYDEGKYTKSEHKAIMGLDFKGIDTTTIKGFEASILRREDGIQIVMAIPAKSIDWQKVVEAAKGGVRKGVQMWSCAARFNSGSINASELIIPPGSMEGPSFERIIIDEIMALEVPVKIALAFAEPVWQGWEFWSETFNLTCGNAFPSFTAFPGPAAPPTPAVPIPVLSATADRDKLTAENLKSRIISRLGKWQEDPEAQKAVEEFTQWFDECFTNAVIKARIKNLMGQGPVPSYNPPRVPSGSVVNGQVIPAPVIFSGLEF